MSAAQIGLVLILSACTAAITLLVMVMLNYAKTRRRIFAGDTDYSRNTPGGVADLDYERSGRTRLLLRSVEAIASRLSDGRVSVDNKTQQKLIQAGIFYDRAVFVYNTARVVFGVILPIILVLILYPLLADVDVLFRFMLIGLIVLIVAALPDVVVSRRREAVQDQCRNGFPDFLDLMVVATEAGMSLEAALSRVSEEVSRHYEHLGRNLYLTNIEIRLGRSLGDALQSLSDRIGIDEIRGFVGTLAQSREYGTSIADTLRVYSDDMRDRRQMNAEEKAQELPVKLVFPLALFLLPVMMMVALWPVIVRLKTAFGGD
jgi:tight adherence protein C